MTERNPGTEYRSGKKLRGLRHGPYRPDLCVLDDIENDEQVRNPDQRDKLHAWLTKTVMARAINSMCFTSEPSCIMTPFSPAS
jgi:hypothetical protein